MKDFEKDKKEIIDKLAEKLAKIFIWQTDLAKRSARITNKKQIHEKEKS